MAKLDLTALDLSALDSGGPSSAGGDAANERKTAHRAPLSAFEEDPDNPRTEFNDPAFDAFVADVRTHGILLPVVVREVEGKLRIRFGARRFRAAKLLHLPDLPYVVTEDERQFDDYSQVSENQQRTPLQPLELANFIQKKLSQGEKKKDVAAKIGIDPSAVTHLLALVDAPAFLLELYHSRKCRAPHYLYELRKLYDKNPELVAERCQATEEIDRAFIAAVSNEVSPKASPAPSPSPATPPQHAESGTASEGQQPGGAPNDGDGSGDAQGAGGAGAGGAQSGAPSGSAAAKGKASQDGSKLRKPLLLGRFQDRPVSILLYTAPSAAGLVHVRYEDDQSEAEVNITSIALTQLTETPAL